MKLYLPLFASLFAHVAALDCGLFVADPPVIDNVNDEMQKVSVVPANGATFSGTIEVTEIKQDEPRNDNEDGDTCADGEIPDQQQNPGVAMVRAERNARGNGRIYLITFTATEGGETCEGVVQVCVPKTEDRECGQGWLRSNSDSDDMRLWDSTSAECTYGAPGSSEDNEDDSEDDGEDDGEDDSEDDGEDDSEDDSDEDGDGNSGPLGGASERLSKLLERFRRGCRPWKQQEC
jgi:hypothetical protein